MSTEDPPAPDESPWFGDDESPFPGEDSLDEGAWAIDLDPVDRHEVAVMTTINRLANRIDYSWTMLERGEVDVGHLRSALFEAADVVLSSDPPGAEVLIEYAIAIADAVADEVRFHAPTLGSTLRAHLDKHFAEAEATIALRGQLAILDAGLSFGCSEQVEELIDLCRSGRRDSVALLTSGRAAEDVVELAVRHRCLPALVAVVRADLATGWRLGWHYGAWVKALDGIATVAWSDEPPASSEARSLLVELLHQPSTCLDAAIRICPRWLSKDVEARNSAVVALDRHEAGLASLPSGQHPEPLATTIHALRSLLWLTQDATTTAANHRYWIRS